MSKGRLEAFSDGVLAIIITIMVLELKPPHGATLDAIKPMWPIFLSYVLSFINVGIYWNNHHHTLQIAKHISGKALWANLHLLFWLSMFPVCSGWMGENHFASLPVAVYAVVSCMAGVAYYIFSKALIAANGKDSPVAKAFGKDVKGILSIIIYLVAIPLTFISNYIGIALLVVVAGIWFIPDKRIEKQLDATTSQTN